MSVVMPVKGVHPESLSNWRTQLRSAYRGEVEYIFVVESGDDPAVPLIRRLMGEAKEANIAIRAAGTSMTCSQKIHNMLAGVDACDARSTYVLFLDDDVRLHRNTIGSLVSSMEANSPEMFLSNGFPFDLPPARGVNFPSYMTMAFHMVLLIAFSHPGEWTKNVWGGCMIVRRSSFANDEHGCRSKYERGGYSDDLILAALCDEFKRTVGAPADCVFPQHIEHTWTQWWNYMRRQLFVMDTYSTSHNKLVNHGMLLVLSYLSLAVTSGVAMCAFDLCAWAHEIVTESGATPGWEVLEWTPERCVSAASFLAFAGAMHGARKMYAELAGMAALLGDEGVMESAGAIDWWRVGAAFWCCYACVPLMAAYTARCVVATPTPTAALHAMNMHKTLAGSENPSSPATPKSIPAAPCRKRPTIISAARPPSALVKLLNAFVAATVPTAKAPKTAPVHPGLYPRWSTARGSNGRGAAMISALVNDTQCSSDTKTPADFTLGCGKKSDAVSYASSFIGESVAAASSSSAFTSSPPRPIPDRAPFPFPPPPSPGADFSSPSPSSDAPRYARCARVASASSADNNDLGDVVVVDPSPKPTTRVSGQYPAPAVYPARPKDDRRSRGARALACGRLTLE